ncbi:MAG: hypothetical protein IPG97_11155 [Microthrixaceae bacterium]|nr:hypothetical protein [Microthrixaceae bacterium]
MSQPGASTSGQLMATSDPAIIRPSTTATSRVDAATFGVIDHTPIKASGIAAM